MNEDKKLKEAIKYLDMMDNKINFDLEGYVYGNEAIETVLQALEKLQKQCKELIKEKQVLTSDLLDSIPKKKIEDKYNELKKQYEEELEKNSIKTFILKCQIEVLQELLEEE